MKIYFNIAGPCRYEKCGEPRCFNYQKLFNIRYWRLYAQHTQATGQIFEPSAIEKVFDQTDGQPWLVNAIAREIIQNISGNGECRRIVFSIIQFDIEIVFCIIHFQYICSWKRKCRSYATTIFDILSPIKPDINRF